MVVFLTFSRPKKKKKTFVNPSGGGNCEFKVRSHEPESHIN